MTHTPPSEAAASSRSNLPDERALEHIARSEDGFYPPAMQAMAREILRMRAQCPPTAEVEQMRDELAQFRQAIGLMTTAKPDMLVDVRDPVGMAQQVVEMVGRLKKDCLANFDASIEQKKRAETAEAEVRRQRVLFDRLHTVDTKQQALLDEIARLFPGRGPLLDRARAAAKVVEQDSIAERVCKELDLDPKKLWLEAMRRTEPKRDVALAPIRGFVDEAVRKVVERARKDGGFPAFGDPFGLLTRRSCKEPKVGPATGQPRTEVPVGPDGSGTVVELGEPFRQSLANAVDCLPSDGHPIDATTVKIAIRNLHAAVSELARVVGGIGARSI